MKVLKFGGTSVGTVKSLSNVKYIVEKINEPVIIVVSALGGLTDKLISASKKAASGDDAFEEELKEIRFRHEEIINALVSPQNHLLVQNKVDELISRLTQILQGLQLIKLLPEQISDLIVSFGERLSSLIISYIIDDAKHHDSLKFIKTEKWRGKNIINSELTAFLIEKEFSGGFNKCVVPGFISTDTASGEITNLGRGGSDYSAALIASALNADILEIWTDVNGFMTADPRIVESAKVIDFLSFTESMELCSFGAKVIYPPTIYPVFHKNIPIKILNTFNPEAPGTLITDNNYEIEMPVKGISPLKDTVMIKLEINRDDNLNIQGRTLNALAKNGIKIFSLTNINPEKEFIFSVLKNDLSETSIVINNEFAPEISSGILKQPQIFDNLTTVAVVGTNEGISEICMNELITILESAEIKVYAFSKGTSDTTLTLLVEAAKTNPAVQIIHDLLIK